VAVAVEGAARAEVGQIGQGEEGEKSGFVEGASYNFLDSVRASSDVRLTESMLELWTNLNVRRQRRDTGEEDATEEGAKYTPGRRPVLGLAADQEPELVHQFVFSMEGPKGLAQQGINSHATYTAKVFSREANYGDTE